MPGTFGDPVRVIENLPGTSRAPGGVGGALIVRGANPADSAVLMDGVQIPLLYHFGGLTSVVNSEFLSAVTFLPGGFGAQYGRATAGVAEMQSAPLACDRVRASASVDLLDAELFGCVPVGRWRVAAAARRSYIDAFLPALLEGAAKEGESPIIVSPAYFDYQLKAETTRARQRFELFAFGSRDALEVTPRHLGRGRRPEPWAARWPSTACRPVTSTSAIASRSSRRWCPGYLMQEFNEGSQDLASEHHSRRRHLHHPVARDRQRRAWPAAARCAAGSTTCSPTGPPTSSPTLPNLARRYPTPLEDGRAHQQPLAPAATPVSSRPTGAELVLAPPTG